MSENVKLGELVISEDARSWLNGIRRPNANPLALNPEVVVCVTSRSVWEGKFEAVHVYYYGQTWMQEWQLREDESQFSISEIGTIDVSIAEGKATVAVQILNENRGNRSTTFVFEHPLGQEEA
jgi:hypothetical protein